jgi:hypothetical protein
MKAAKRAAASTFAASCAVIAFSGRPPSDSGALEGLWRSYEEEPALNGQSMQSAAERAVAAEGSEMPGLSTALASQGEIV